MTLLRRSLLSRWRENCSDLELIWAVRGVRIKSHTCALQQEQTRWNSTVYRLVVEFGFNFKHFGAILLRGRENGNQRQLQNGVVHTNAVQYKERRVYIREDYSSWVVTFYVYVKYNLKTL